jgi:Protein of unknown function (DUF4238)
MAGRKHHYIPQFLQRGFAARLTPGGETQVWVFRKGSEPYITGTSGTFASRDFYGEPESAEVDETITQQETELSSFVNQARALNGPTVIGQSETAAAFVHQVSIRVRWVRELFAGAATAALEHVGSLTATAEGSARFMSSELRKKPSVLTEELKRQFAKQSGRRPNRGERRKIEAEAKRLLKDRAQLVSLLKADKLPLPVSELTAAIPSMVTGGHLKALTGALGDLTTNFGNYMRSLTWEVVPMHSPLILGDCGPIYFDATGKPIGPMGSARHDDAAGLVLPISSRTALVGFAQSGAAVPVVAALNESTAGWSCEAFIAAAHNGEFRALHSKLGTQLSEYVAHEARDAFADFGSDKRG